MNYPLLVMREVTGLDGQILDTLAQRDYISRRGRNVVGTPDSQLNQWHSMQVFVYPPGYDLPRPTEEEDGSRHVPILPGDRVFIDNDHPFDEYVALAIQDVTRGFALASAEDFRLMAQGLETVRDAEQARRTARLSYSVTLDKAEEEGEE